MSESRLTFVRFDHFKKVKMSDGYMRSVPYDLYACSCGNEKVIARRKVKRNATRSCGCLISESAREKLKRVNELGINGPNIRPNVGNINDINKNGKCGKAVLGKVRWYREDGSYFMITKERADALYYGLEGEVHSLRIREAPNKGKKFVNGKYV